MRNLYKILLVFFIWFPWILPAQLKIEPFQVQGYHGIPKEKVFVQYNNSLLFAGEYIYYKVYVLNSNSKKLSSLSKVAYVELVGEDGTQVFKHKLDIQGGAGQGDYFIPTTVPSGNYKLLGYTQWMLNGGQQNIFRSDVALLNPYRGDQRAVTPNDTTSAKNSENIIAEGDLQTRNISGDLGLVLNRRNYSPRQQVLLKLTGNLETSAGNYAISVRRLENIRQPAMPTATGYNQMFKVYQEDISTEVHLPELRGELLWGRVVPVDNSEEISIQNKRIALSIPGEDYLVKVAGTNRKGEFFFNIKGDYSGANAFLEVIGDGKEKYKIQVAQMASVDHKFLSFNDFHISPEMEDMIIERSVYNQIENAYYSVKPDTLLTGNVRKPFYEKPPVLYKLDDYTRFPTIRETFIEIIKEAFVRNLGGGSPAVRVRTPENATVADLPPLILVDGVVVMDHARFLNIPAREIQEIRLIRDNYYLGPHMFQGILDVKTITGKFYEQFVASHGTTIEMEKSQPKKRYFRQKYSGSNNGNIPDFRYQLFWEPEVMFTAGEANMEFYTSDVKGNFEIRVEGFSGDGTPVSLRDFITVE